MRIRRRTGSIPSACYLSYRFPSGSAIHVGPGVTGNRSARRYGLSVGIAVPQSLVF